MANTNKKNNKNDKKFTVPTWLSNAGNAFVSGSRNFAKYSSKKGLQALGYAKQHPVKTGLGITLIAASICMYNNQDRLIRYFTPNNTRYYSSLTITSSSPNNTLDYNPNDSLTGDTLPCPKSPKDFKPNNILPGSQPNPYTPPSEEKVIEDTTTNQKVVQKPTKKNHKPTRKPKQKAIDTIVNDTISVIPSANVVTDSSKSTFNFQEYVPNCFCKPEGELK